MSPKDPISFSRLISIPSGKIEHEKSTVGLYFASSPPTQAFTTIQLPPIFGVFEGLDIPADEGHYTIKDSFVIPIDVRAFSVGAHAHYLGKQMRLTATLPERHSENAAADRRLGLLVAGAVSLRGVRVAPKGTRLDAEVTYDNTSANKRNPSRPPVRVTWGEESTDEMGSIGLQVVAGSPTELPQLRQAFLAHIRQAAITRPGLGQLLGDDRRARLELPMGL